MFLDTIATNADPVNAVLLILIWMRLDRRINRLENRLKTD